MVNWDDEYTGGRQRRLQKAVQVSDIMAAIGVIAVITMLYFVNIGVYDPDPKTFVDGYHEPIPDLVNTNEMYLLTLNLRSNTISAQNPILASAKLDVHPFLIFRNFTTNEPLDVQTMKPMPPYIRLLFNGTQCIVPEDHFAQLVPCWMDLKLNDYGYSNITYTGEKVISYSHGGPYHVQLAYPANNSKEKSHAADPFIQIASAESIR